MGQSANPRSTPQPSPHAEASPPPSRRAFLRRSALAAGGIAAANLAIPRMVHAAGDDAIRFGLIGCGGRGVGAAENALNADPNNRLVALADLFPDQVRHAREHFARRDPNRATVAEDHCFDGFEAYKRLIDFVDIDVVLMATPPHFRPAHYEYAVNAGKHCFVEKPVAVDAPGIRRVMAANKIAQEKKLTVVSGLCWRYDLGVRETMKRVQDGAIGDIIAVQENYNAGFLWHKARKPEWTDMEYQIRNWLYYTWLSGDHNVEQHVHSLDKASWVMGDKPPVRATGLGGRQVRTAPEFGNIFDHHAVVYEYENGVRVFAFCRQQDGTSMDTEDYFFGTKGQARILKNEIVAGGEKWRYRGATPNMYDNEHKEMFAAMRKGEVIYNGDYMATSSMLAILGRMCTYTGRTLTWDEAINSKEDLSPAKYEFGPLEVPPVAKPGRTKFA
ncbi:MAG: oxidoreductase [Planctomycetota bacterium]|nr:MAG: oxidoreductase [Planctomycetota bacterium]